MKLPSPKRKPQPAPVSFDADALRPLLRAAEMTGLSVVALHPTGAPLGEGEELFECPLCRARARRGLSLCRRRTQEATRAAEVAAERGLMVRVTASLPFEFARAVEDLTAPAATLTPTSPPPHYFFSGGVAFMFRGRSRGFTLIELLVVIAIIAILAAILLPVF